MYCTSCGKEMRADDRFCPSCGKVAATATAYGPQGRPRLMRIHQGKKIAGVCGGIARHYDWDPTLVRVAFLAAFFLHGIGLLAYIVLWIAVPNEEYYIYSPAR
ncbi:MAG: PspC domain-containing protein [Bryobacteraceae bacterium]|jgi:phage shock protein PspC (stress-responsive transcriptional regulator)